MLCPKNLWRQDHKQNPHKEVQGEFLRASLWRNKQVAITCAYSPQHGQPTGRLPSLTPDGFQGSSKMCRSNLKGGHLNDHKKLKLKLSQQKNLGNLIAACYTCPKRLRSKDWSYTMHIVPVVDSVLGHMRMRIESFQTENIRSKVVITWFHAKQKYESHMGL